MKKVSFLSMLLVFGLLSTTMGQEADKILEKHFKAMGQETLLKVKTVQATGTASMMGMTTGFEMKAKRPNKVHVKIDIQGMTIVQAFDGETAWMINPMMGSSTPQAVTGPEAQTLKDQANLDGQLWNYKEKGSTLELEGSESLGGKDAHVLKLTRSNGNVERYFIDKESNLLVMVRVTAPVNGSPTTMETHLSDYKDFDGYKMPMITQQKMGGQTVTTITMTDVKINDPVEDSVFSMSSGS
ncbi:MAG: outer membrane lipoprotein-sorting protein [Bacteroidales bacterium]